MKTVKLYDDGHLYEFDANVISCEKENEIFKTVLDKTAFFPEGGGQYGDTGFIEDTKIIDTQIYNDIIYHYSNSPLPVGDKVHCMLDKDKRFARMQNHSGEHIVSGIVNRLFGYDNVGFHLGDDGMTVDFNGELTREQLMEVEKIANEAIYKNVNFTISYPDEKELETLEYRSKLDLTEDVRIVTIDGYDKCACCAPHVSKSGEIGIIKILDSQRHRGGIRIHMLCGIDAVKDYNVKYNNLYEIAVKLCAKQNETAESFNKYSEETSLLKQKIAQLNKEITKLKSSTFTDTNECILIFEEDLDMQNLRNLVLSGVKHTSKICAGFSGNDSTGYVFAIASEHINLREQAKVINLAISGKGGGSAELIQGSCSADRNTIENHFKTEW